MFDDPLRIDARVTQLVLVGFLKNEISKSGFRRAVISVTGDIDATLTCYLTVEALGPENVTVIHMPESDSGMPSSGIKLLESELGVVCHVVDINPHRCGHSMSGTGHPIVAPAELETLKPDVIIVMNPVYRDEIVADLNSMGLEPDVLTL